MRTALEEVGSEMDPDAGQTVTGSSAASMQDPGEARAERAAALTSLIDAMESFAAALDDNGELRRVLDSTVADIRSYLDGDAGSVSTEDLAGAMRHACPDVNVPVVGAL